MFLTLCCHLLFLNPRMRLPPAGHGHELFEDLRGRCLSVGGVQKGWACCIRQFQYLTKASSCQLPKQKQCKHSFSVLLNNPQSGFHWVSGLKYSIINVTGKIVIKNVINRFTSTALLMCRVTLILRVLSYRVTLVLRVLTCRVKLIQCVLICRVTLSVY